MFVFSSRGRLTAGIVAVCVAMCSVGVCLAQDAQKTAFPGDRQDWQGFPCSVLQVKGCAVRVLAPLSPAVGSPWMLSAAEAPSPLDAALLRHGFHVARMDATDGFGSPRAVEQWEALYTMLTEEHGLSARAVIEGRGPGALLAYNWAAKHTDCVACIVADDPNLDVRVWPIGQGKAQRDEEAVKRLLEAYGFSSEADVLAKVENPVDHGELFAQAKTPILHVISEDAPQAPYKENTAPFRRKYYEKGGSVFDVIVKPSQWKEAYLPENVAVAYFVMRHASAGGAPASPATPEELAPWKVADFPRSGQVNTWDNVAFVERGDDMTGINWGEPFERMNYEISLEAMRVAGDDFFCALTFPVGEDPCTLVVGGWAGTTVGLSCLDYQDASSNESTRFMEFDKGRWYRIRLRVTDGKIEAWIDDKQMVDVNTQGKTIGIRWECEPSVPLGISTWRTTGAVRGFSIKPVSGT